MTSLQKTHPSPDEALISLKNRRLSSTRCSMSSFSVCVCVCVTVFDVFVCYVAVCVKPVYARSLARGFFTFEWCCGCELAAWKGPSLLFDYPIKLV